jgi:hypothetical protein
MIWSESPLLLVPIASRENFDDQERTKARQFTGTDVPPHIRKHPSQPGEYVNM